MKTIISIFTNQYFLLFLAIVLGLLIGKIKVKNFSFGISAPIFSGIFIGWLVTEYAKNAQEGSVGYSAAQTVLKNGIVPGAFSTFFLLLFLAATGLTAGKNIKNILKKYGAKFVVIGAIIPLVSMIVTVVMYTAVLSPNDITSFSTSGMYAGAMTSTPAYGTAVDAIGSNEIAERYVKQTEKNRQKTLELLEDESLTLDNTSELTEEQISLFKTNAKTQLSLAYTLTFPAGILIIVFMITFLPKIFHINIEEERKSYEAEMFVGEENRKNIPEQPMNYMSFALVGALGIALGSIKIPMLSTSFTLGIAGGTLIAALFCSYLGKIGPFNFRIENKSLTVLYQMGIIYFMAVTGLSNGYSVVHSLSGNGVILVVAAMVVEFVAVMIAFFIGRKVFHLNWTILSGAIAGGCTSAPGLGAAISTIGNDVPTTGYGASQPFAILSNVIMIMIFYKIFFI